MNVLLQDSLRKKQQPPVSSTPVSVSSSQTSPTSFNPAISVTSTAQPTVQSLQQHTEIKEVSYSLYPYKLGVLDLRILSIGLEFGCFFRFDNDQRTANSLPAFLPYESKPLLISKSANLFSCQNGTSCFGKKNRCQFFLCEIFLLIYSYLDQIVFGILMSLFSVSKFNIYILHFRVSKSFYLRFYKKKKSLTLINSNRYSSKLK